ncbi:hypothetical protein Vadar_028955 [Vaccinium darrowii]|uniref:Uncharacterized protein n=1 Tax=Vaccinium darrowii TaxID=229202 RepID=A0ACB7XUW6_9ERIC|nr:hypothetical protein Vadar_028955 [Vaccinium darrowii]
MGSVKNRERNKLFMCFRPAAIEDDSIKPDAVFTDHISGEGKKLMVFPKILTSLSEEKPNVSSDGSDERPALSNKKRSRRSFFRIGKAVLFDASLGKKAHNRKDIRTSNPSTSNTTSGKIQKVLHSINDHKMPSNKEPSAADDGKIDHIGCSSLDSSSSTTSSSNPPSSSGVSSFTSNSRPSSEDKESFRSSSVESKQIGGLASTGNVGEHNSVDIGLCLFLVCLSVLIFCGRVCAIFCTLILFLLLPGRDKGVDSPRDHIELTEIGSEEHTNRVIKEELLIRTQNQVPYSKNDNADYAKISKHLRFDLAR